MNKLRFSRLALLLVVFVVVFLEKGSAWDGFPEIKRLAAEVSDEHLIGDILAVDVKARRVLVLKGGRQYWLWLASDAVITRNGISAPLDALAPVSEGIYQQAYLFLDQRGLVTSVETWFYAIPVRIVEVQESSAPMISVELLNCNGIYTFVINPGSVLVSAGDGIMFDFSDGLCGGHIGKNQVGVAILSRDLELRYFIAYQK